MCQFELFAPGLGVSTSQICVQQVKIVQKKLVQLSTQGGARGVLGPGNYIGEFIEAFTMNCSHKTCLGC